MTSRNKTNTTTFTHLHHNGDDSNFTLVSKFYIHSIFDSIPQNTFPKQEMFCVAYKKHKLVRRPALCCFRLIERRRSATFAHVFLSPLSFPQHNNRWTKGNLNFKVFTNFFSGCVYLITQTGVHFHILPHFFHFINPTLFFHVNVINRLFIHS